MKTRLLILTLAGCMIATPAMADLFHFSVHTLDMTYDTSSDFVASLNADEGGIFFTRDIPTIGTVILGKNPGDFTISMTISNIVGLTADGSGDFTLTDVDGDRITGDVEGEWEMTGGTPTFAGAMSNVLWHNDSSDNNFEGDSGWPIGDPTSVSMIFTASQPWRGTLIELTASGASWFGDGAWVGNYGPLTITGGSLDAHVLPVPAAVLLGVLGLGVAGWKLRKYV